MSALGDADRAVRRAPKLKDLHGLTGRQIIEGVMADVEERACDRALSLSEVAQVRATASVEVYLRAAEHLREMNAVLAREGALPLSLPGFHDVPRSIFDAVPALERSFESHGRMCWSKSFESQLPAAAEFFARRFEAVV